MKKIIQYIFSKNLPPVTTPVKIEFIRCSVETPDSIPGQRADLHKRQSSSAPIEMDASPGRH